MTNRAVCLLLQAEHSQATACRLNNRRCHLHNPSLVVDLRRQQGGARDEFCIPVVQVKKLPVYRGYNYACNIVDCFSRFAMGGPIKNKSATFFFFFFYVHIPSSKIIKKDNDTDVVRHYICRSGKSIDFLARSVDGQIAHGSIDHETIAKPFKTNRSIWSSFETLYVYDSVNSFSNYGNQLAFLRAIFFSKILPQRH